MSVLPAWLRRVRDNRIPVGERCNQGNCPNRAVVYETPMDASTTDPDEQQRRCLEYPPPHLAAAVARGDRCSRCGRGYWPDFLHLDCEPDDDVAIGCQRATSDIETEHN